MNSKTEIAIYKCLAQSSEEIMNVWKSIAKAEIVHHNRTKKDIWDIMGRGIMRENSYGDITEVSLNISDWRELCELVEWGVFEEE